MAKMDVIVMNGKYVAMLASEVKELEKAYRKFHTIAVHDHLDKDAAVKNLERLIEELESITSQIKGLYEQGITNQIIRNKIKALHNRANPIEQEIGHCVSGMTAAHGNKFHMEISSFFKELDALLRRMNPWLDRIRKEIVEIEQGKYTMNAHGTVQTDFYGKPIIQGEPVARYAVRKMSDL